MLDKLNQVLTDHGIVAASSIDDLDGSSAQLTEMVKNDPRSQELSDLGSLEKVVDRVMVSGRVEQLLAEYVDQAMEFKREEAKVIDILLIGLYEQGKLVLGARLDVQEDTRHCPLCGQEFLRGDLLQHIATELNKLQKLKVSHERLESMRKEAQGLLQPLMNIVSPLAMTSQAIGNESEDRSLDGLITEASEIETVAGSLAARLSTRPENLGLDEIRSISLDLQSLKLRVRRFETSRIEFLHRIRDRLDVLNQDSSRAQLVSDYGLVVTALDQWKLKSARRNVAQLQGIHSAYEITVDDYIRSSIENVMARFKTVSADVKTFFEILEEDMEGLGRPVLRLLTDQERAVVLQVEFHGEPIYPAYRYLSESQLNSFGLAVFLASAKYFNQGFKFLILDDVINSFDGYKRPKVIKILKQELADFQVLILTHDSIWCDRLFRECPTWVKRRFIGHKPEVGPIMREGVAPLDVIEQLLDEDEPVRAGRNMGPFLECQLQELSEAFEAMIKYNQRNEYTLDTLLDRFRVRVKEKLGASHLLHVAVQALQTDQGFRNLCAHWKDRDVELTLQEMTLVVSEWKAIEELVRCTDENCHSFLRYDGKSGFVCQCGKTRLSKS